jgi:hypothetical protein
MHRQLAGTVEADELYHTAGNKGRSLIGASQFLKLSPEHHTHFGQLL